MRIAEISTLQRPVKPDSTASVESLVYTITEGLVERGHDVTLFALAGSRTSARLQSPVETSYSVDGSKWDWQLYEAYQVREAFRRWKDFDIIHCHSYHHGLLCCDFVSIPSLHSIHIDPGPDYVFLGQLVKKRHLVFCSKYQARDFAGMRDVYIIPHGLDMQQYYLCDEERREPYLAFLGRFMPDKGPLEAIQFARKVGLPIKLAGEENEYFQEYIAPEIQKGGVEYAGELRGSQKIDFLARAKALLYPLQRGEPFGLVLIEAMACGLPVLALNKGASPEIIEHGQTGWLGWTMKDLEDGFKHLEEFDPVLIRKRAEERYSVDIMIDRLEQLMQQIIEERNNASRR
ncbi:glycosyltransferase family 4 protein [Candidatus Sumerlaeota bacterium]|nr:glycosyltransferase family 4 protein [Candidatus Sumerlaeota bacterium]